MTFMYQAGTRYINKKDIVPINCQFDRYFIYIDKEIIFSILQQKSLGIHLIICLKINLFLIWLTLTSLLFALWSLFQLQDLTISISTERSIHEIEIIEDQSSLSSVNTQAFLDASEWNLYNHTESYRDKTTVEYARSTVHPILHIQCRVARKIGYFVWNIIFIVVCNYYNFSV